MWRQFIINENSDTKNNKETNIYAKLPFCAIY